MKKKIGFPKPKKVKKSTLKNKADKLFSAFIRSKGVCEASDCGTNVRCGGQLQCAHLISRWNLRLRWDKANALCICAGHHRFFTTRPLEWAEFLRENYSSQYAYVMAHKNEISKISFEEVIERLEKLVPLL